MYTDEVTFRENTDGGSYDSDRVWQAGSAGKELWSGYADVQLMAKEITIQQAGDEDIKANGRIFVPLGEEEAVLEAISLHTLVETPYGNGRVTRIRPTDGNIYALIYDG